MIRPLTMADCVECYAVPGSDSMIDVIHPVTGLTVYGNKTMEQVQAETPGAVRMLVEQFCNEKAQRQRAPITWSPVTEEKYTEMLEVLPPALWEGRWFLVGEPWDHDAGNGQPRFAAYGAIGGKYYTASRPLTRKEMREQLNATAIQIEKGNGAV